MASKVTLEDFQQILKEVAVAQKEVAASQKKTEESLRDFKKSTAAAQKEVAEAQKEVAEAQKEVAAAQKKTEEGLQDFQRKTEHYRRESEKGLQELKKETRRMLGEFNDRWGNFMENLIEEDLLKLMQEKDIAVHEVHPNVTALKNDGYTKLAEYDLVAYNGDELVVVETKTTLFTKDVMAFIEKLKKFKGYFGAYKNHKVYGAVAYMGVSRDDKGKAAKRAEEEGLFVIKSPEGGPGMAALTNGEGFSPKTF